ncbi:MAG: NifB/NifX family molybdenum-iron cluster-binding protein [Bacteroidales bacterium]
MSKKYAIPVTGGVISSHFGHCEVFYFADVEGNKISNETLIAPPEHEPGLYPKWVKEQGADIVIGGGMGSKAKNLFTQENLEIIIGAPNMEPRKALEDYLAGNLSTGLNNCDH